MAQFFTVGHSTRSFEEFLALLREAGIARLIDVRTIPRSRRNPQFGTERLAEQLSANGIVYEHMPALGGLRKKQPVDKAVNGYWRNASFHNYADYALSREFREALQQLRAKGERERCAVMCAEAHYSQCHRQLIADHLLGAGETVFHIVKAGQIVEAKLSAGARAGRDGVVTYPGDTQGSLFPRQDAH
jgi:uncharacterized protein (DUF488 family)